ncbi:hypothetical protein D3C86_1763980 [compost metagenome]
MEFRSFSDCHWIEVSAFQKYRFGFRRNATFASAKNAGNAKWIVFSVFDDDLGTVQSSFNTIQSFEFCSFLYGSYFHNLVCNFVRIKSVKRLSKTVKNIIGDIDHIIDRRKTDGFQSCFQPIWRSFHFYIFDHCTQISWRKFRVFYL